MEIALHDLGLHKKNAKPLLSSAVANDVEFACQDVAPEEERTKFRSINLRLFLSQDFSAFDAPSEERQRSRCRCQRWELGSLISRYLVGRPRCVQRLEVQSMTVNVDSDFAGCRETRLSTSCCMLMRGKHSAAARASSWLSYVVVVWVLEQRRWLKILGSSSVSSWRDFSAAKGVATRRGVENIRHLRTPLVWL